MSQSATSGTPVPDVVDLLVGQHALIRQLFEEAAGQEGDAQQDAVERLVRLLAVHETAEEEIVHPLARRVVPEGDRVVDDRLHEEHDAKKMLEQLDGMSPKDPQFMGLLGTLRDAVLTHARHEEQYEFNWLRQRCKPGQLAQAAKAVKAAERFAPTHPHAGAETAPKNLVAGPVLAVMDRVKDAIRKSREEKGDSSS